MRKHLACMFKRYMQLNKISLTYTQEMSRKHAGGSICMTRDDQKLKV